MTTSQVQKTTNETESLYLVNLEYKSDGTYGGGSMVLQLAVDPADGTLDGRAYGTIQEGTERGLSFAVAVSGHTHSTGLSNVTRVGAVSGQAIVSVPPPAIGSYLDSFTASFAVDQDWKGTGQFSVGDEIYKCEVAEAQSELSSDQAPNHDTRMKVFKNQNTGTKITVQQRERGARHIVVGSNEEVSYSMLLPWCSNEKEMLKKGMTIHEGDRTDRVLFYIFQDPRKGDKVSYVIGNNSFSTRQQLIKGSRLEFTISKNNDGIYSLSAKKL